MVPFFDAQIRKTITILKQVSLSIIISQGIKKDVFYSTSQLNISNILVFCFFFIIPCFLWELLGRQTFLAPRGLFVAVGE